MVARGIQIYEYYLFLSYQISAGYLLSLQLEGCGGAGVQVWGYPESGVVEVTQQQGLLRNYVAEPSLNS